MSGYAEIKKVGFSSDGSCAYVTFEFEDKSEESLCLLFDVYSEHVRGKFLFDKSEYSEICKLSETSSAILSGLRSLACSPSTKKEIERKLRAKGYAHYACEGAISYFTAHGYIKEGELMVSEIKASLRKKHGPVRIRSRLISRGFPDAMITKGMSKLSGYDFESACLELARKRAENTTGKK